ncbi:MAG: vanadium nitrogenase [Lachnospiraceae bacterium]|nr:vanadium nitrogenase [Lachnospiraceae bacterium]
MLFINELITYAILVVIMGALAVAGIFLGKSLRDRHDAKGKKAE